MATNDPTIDSSYIPNNSTISSSGVTLPSSITVTAATSLGAAALASNGFLTQNVKNPTIAAPVTPKAKTSTSTTTPANSGLNINGYSVSREDMAELEKKTNLTYDELAYIKNHMSNPMGVDPNNNCYFLMLTLLVYGFDFKVLTANISPGHATSIIDLNFINDFKLLINDKTASKFIKKTPAYSMGCFDNVGSYGVTLGANSGMQRSNPITGAPQVTSSLVTDAMEKLHPGATQDLINFCNKIRTHAWLSLPKGSFGSLGRIVTKIQKVIEAFEAIISDIYQGCIILIQKLYAYINGIIAWIQKKLLSIINSIIPLDLLCLILETLQVIMDDINFFTSLFQMSGPFMNYLNSFQNYLNITSQLVSNPFSTISSYFPPQVNNIINMVNQIGSDPNGFMADQLNNYGYGYVLNALQGNLLGALVNKYGPKYAAITPLGNALTKATAVYSRFGGQFPATPATMGPNIYTGLKGTRTDVYGMPTQNLFDVANNDFNNFGQAVSDLGAIGSDAKSALTEVGDSIKSIFGG